MHPANLCTFCDRLAAERAVRSAYPSLYRDHPRSAFAPGDGAAGLAIIASWQAHRDAGEYPVIVDGRSKVEWRKAA